MVETFEHSTLLTNPSKFINSPKLLSQQRKYYHKTFGIIVINSPMSPFSLTIKTSIRVHRHPEDRDCTEVLKVQRQITTKILLLKGN